MIAAEVESPLVERLRRELARGTGDLPVLGPAAQQALVLARRPEIEVRDVVEVAESLAPFAARLMAVANSALYYRGVTISSLPLAVMRLGMQAVRDVIYQSVYSSALFDTPGYRDLVQTVFGHGAITAHVSRALGEQLRVDADTAFLAGLLHDIGRARCLKLAARFAKSDVDRRIALAAIDELHGSAGAELASAWKLPDPVIEACARHHHPRPDDRWAGLVHVADRIAHAVEKASDESVDVMAADLAVSDAEAALASLGIDPFELDRIADMALSKAKAEG